MIKLIKSSKVLIVSLFLFAGMGTAHLYNANNAQAYDAADCSKTYCQNGECESGGNMTDCASPDGEPPCTGHINCM